MYLSKAALILSLAVSALALPLHLPTPSQKRANVLKVQAYADFQVSDGVAGNALAEVRAKFPVCSWTGFAPRPSHRSSPWPTGPSQTTQD